MLEHYLSIATRAIFIADPFVMDSSFARVAQVLHLSIR